MLKYIEGFKLLLENEKDSYFVIDNSSIRNLEVWKFKDEEYGDYVGFKITTTETHFKGFFKNEKLTEQEIIKEIISFLNSRYNDTLNLNEL